MYGNRVVVTGLGVHHARSATRSTSTGRNLLSGVSGAGADHRASIPTDLPVQIAAEVKGFDPGDYMDRKAAKRMERFSQFSIAATGEALRRCRAWRSTTSNAWDVGAVIATGGGGIGAVADETETLVTRGWERVGPMMVPLMIANMASCQVSMHYGIKGPVVTNTAACAAGVYSMFEALHFLRRGDAVALVAGGTESAILPLAFISMARTGALSRRNDDPQTASRPFDKDRDGFVFGEGAGILVLETLDHARSRGARILAELAGASITADAYHVSAPEPSGESAKRAILKAIQDADLRPEEIDYVCAHGTSTPLNDSTETKALKLALGEHAYRIPVSSVKSMIGHLLGAAGALSAVATVKTHRDGLHPADDQPVHARSRVRPGLRAVEAAQRLSVRNVMVNGFGFGGQNSVAVFKKWRATGRGAQRGPVKEKRAVLFVHGVGEQHKSQSILWMGSSLVDWVLAWCATFYTDQKPHVGRVELSFAPTRRARARYRSTWRSCTCPTRTGTWPRRGGRLELPPDFATMLSWSWAHLWDILSQMRKSTLERVKGLFAPEAAFERARALLARGRPVQLPGRVGDLFRRRLRRLSVADRADGGGPDPDRRRPGLHHHQAAAAAADDHCRRVQELHRRRIAGGQHPPPHRRLPRR